MMTARKATHRRPDSEPVPSPAHAPEALEALEARLGHAFADRGLLIAALTHPSRTGVPARRAARPGASEAGPDYQRLEFLGDALVGAVLSELLFARCPDAREGALTVRRAAMVREARLAEAARALALPPLITAGVSETAQGFGDRDSVLADVFEAIVAALWLDAPPAGQVAARALLARLFADDLGLPRDAELLKPAKSRLQELVQARWKLQPRYLLDPESTAPESVVVSVVIAPHLTVRAEGRSRREAEQRAAELALTQLAGESQP
jgi:ribonuclease-3